VNALPLLLLASLVPAGNARDGPLACRVTPRRIDVGPFYDGAAVAVDGAVAAGSSVVVVVAGSDREEKFNKKGRFGPIWLNSGKVSISGVPSLFLRFSAHPVAGLLSRACIEAHELDRESLARRLRMEPQADSPASGAKLRADYLALKEAEGLYAFGDAGIRLGPQDGECAPFQLQFHWPKQAPPAAYQVRVYEVRDGSVTRELTVPMEVVRTAFPAWLAAMAASRASLYGIVAVLVGALAGFGIDFLTTRLFGGKRAAAA
jgi:hypothetical protein